LFLVLNSELIDIVAASKKQVECEQFENFDYGRYGGVQKTCHLNTRTSIDSPDTTISSTNDTTVEGIDMDNNYQIQFLPFEIYKSFPNLVALSAHHCSIKAITKDNFKNLNKLRIISMGTNPISKIPDDAFERLESLEHLDLCELFKFCF